MARTLEDAYWLYEENVSSVLFPRGYNPSSDRPAFLADFRLTAAAGLLKWFVLGMDAADETILATDPARPAIPIARLEFATERCREHVAVATHEDIDAAEGDERRPSDEEWSLFLTDYQAALHHGAGIECSSQESREHLQVTGGNTTRKPS